MTGCLLYIVFSVHFRGADVRQYRAQYSNVNRVEYVDHYLGDIDL